MALKSPRFTSSHRLSQAAENSPPLRRGARGRGVHLVQFALLDLGYAMPRSTGGNFSPDGIYGEETVNVVKAFQKSQSQTDDGEVGRKTMQALDAAFPRASHRVRVHFRSISLTDVPFDQMLRNAATVYGQYGIDFQFGSGESLLLSDAEAALFDRIDDECHWVITAGEYDQLHKLGTPCPTTDVKVFFVNQMRDDLGCGGHAPDRPAATVAKEAWRWDMAHEVGHVLLTSTFAPVHHPHWLNLMNEYPPNDPVIKVLTNAQVKKMRTHPCCITS
jgi:hypothetical protein